MMQMILKDRTVWSVASFATHFSLRKSRLKHADVQAARIVSGVFRLVVVVLITVLLIRIDEVNLLIAELVDNTLNKESLLLWCLLWLLYIVLLSCPFVPGAELGLILMAMGDPLLILMVYLMTLVALSIAYGVGSVIKDRFSIPGCGVDFHTLMQQYTFLKPISCPYLIIGLLLNTPGNSIIGGGGGIAMICGYSRQIPWPRFLITTALAVAPLPLVCLMFKTI